MITKREYKAHPESWWIGKRCAAITEIPSWFVAGGGAPHLRFRSTEGELHHLRYGRTEREDPRAIEDVRWMHKECHQRVESAFGTRRRFLLSGGR